MKDGPAQVSVRSDGGKGVLCAKCDHLNPPGSTMCEYCHAALFGTCRHCGKTVQRTSDRCEFCGHHTRHKSPRHSQFWRQLFTGGNRITLWQVALLIVVVYGAYRVFLILAQ